MFENEFQGGAVVDIFSAQGKDPVARWKLYGGQSAISKVFDKHLKGFVYVLEGSSQANKMQMPKDNQITLGLSQRFLVLQMYIPHGKDFSTELMSFKFRTRKGCLQRDQEEYNSSDQIVKLKMGRQFNKGSIRDTLKR